MKLCSMSRWYRSERRGDRAAQDAVPRRRRRRHTWRGRFVERIRRAVGRVAMKRPAPCDRSFAAIGPAVAQLPRHAHGAAAGARIRGLDPALTTSPVRTTRPRIASRSESLAVQARETPGMPSHRRRAGNRGAVSILTGIAPRRRRLGLIGIGRRRQCRTRRPRRRRRDQWSGWRREVVEAIGNSIAVGVQLRVVAVDAGLDAPLIVGQVEKKS